MLPVRTSSRLNNMNRLIEQEVCLVHAVVVADQGEADDDDNDNNNGTGQKHHRRKKDALQLQGSTSTSKPTSTHTGKSSANGDKCSTSSGTSSSTSTSKSTTIKSNNSVSSIHKNNCKNKRMETHTDNNKGTHTHIVGVGVGVGVTAPATESATTTDNANVKTSTSVQVRLSKYLPEITFMLREFEKLESQLLQNNTVSAQKESNTSQSRREKLRSFILHITDVMGQIQMLLDDKDSSTSTREQAMGELEQHILTSLLPVKDRLKKQLSATSTQHKIQKGTFAAAAARKRAESHFGKPLAGGGSSLTQKLHGNTLGSSTRKHGSGVGSVGETASTPRKVLYGGMAASCSNSNHASFSSDSEDESNRQSLPFALTEDARSKTKTKAIASTKFNASNKTAMPPPPPSNKVMSAWRQQNIASENGNTNKKQRSSISAPATAAANKACSSSVGTSNIKNAAISKSISSSTKSNISLKSDTSIDKLFRKDSGGMHRALSEAEVDLTAFLFSPNVRPDEAKSAHDLGPLPEITLSSKTPSPQEKIKPLTKAKMTATGEAPELLTIKTKASATSASAPENDTKEKSRARASLNAAATGTPNVAIHPAMDESTVVFLPTSKSRKRRRRMEGATMGYSMASSGHHSRSSERGSSSHSAPPSSRDVEYICALCNETYRAECTANPWWALTQEPCLKCGKAQIPRIDISAPANTIEYHPALLAHADEGNDGDSDARNNSSSVSGGGMHMDVGNRGGYDSGSDSEDSDPGEDFGKVYAGPKLESADAAQLLVLMAHASICPGRHKNERHRQVCLSVKYLMLHVRDCPGTISSGDLCPFPWCRKVKHLLYHLISCSKPNECRICRPRSLPKKLIKMAKLNFLQPQLARKMAAGNSGVSPGRKDAKKTNSVSGAVEKSKKGNTPTATSSIAAKGNVVAAKANVVTGSTPFAKDTIVNKGNPAVTRTGKKVQEGNLTSDISGTKTMVKQQAIVTSSHVEVTDKKQKPSSAAQQSIVSSTTKSVVKQEKLSLPKILIPGITIKSKFEDISSNNTSAVVSKPRVDKRSTVAVSAMDKGPQKANEVKATAPVSATVNKPQKANEVKATAPVSATVNKPQKANEVKATAPVSATANKPQKANEMKATAPVSATINKPQKAKEVKTTAPAATPKIIDCKKESDDVPNKEKNASTSAEVVKKSEIKVPVTENLSKKKSRDFVDSRASALVKNCSATPSDESSSHVSSPANVSSSEQISNS